MTKPAGNTKLKDNSKKKYREAEEFKLGKKIGRPKQHWVWNEPMAVPAGLQPEGHWEKIK